MHGSRLTAHMRSAVRVGAACSLHSPPASIEPARALCPACPVPGSPTPQAPSQELQPRQAPSRDPQLRRPRPGSPDPAGPIPEAPNQPFWDKCRLTTEPKP
eukprot:363843-Chlamydomonas_euryale.AAC.5